MRFSYNDEYFPSAPCIDIRLGIADESLRIGPLTAFVDSGADMTVVPLYHIQTLPIAIDDRGFMRSQWGERRLVDIYRLDLGIGDIRLPSVQIIGDDQSNEVIIGRNVLNMLRVYMDGPRQLVTITE